MKKYLIIQLLLFLLISSSGCSMLKKNENQKTENEVENTEEQPKKKRFKFNTYEKADDYVSKKGGLIFGKKQEYEFSDRNVIWRASLDALSELPILTASYSGGIISTDWYGDGKSQIRLNVVFNSTATSPSSLKITSFIKNCNSQSNKCTVKNGSNDFNSKIKDKIIAQVKSLKAQENK